MLLHHLRVLVFTKVSCGCFEYSWVFASLYTQPLEAAAIRSLIRTRLGLPGAPQMLLQLGRARTTQATARRPPAELIEP